LREDEIKEVADSLSNMLARYTGSTVLRLPFTFKESRFTRYIFDDDSTYTAENIVARLSGTGEIDGVFLVTAHYDAIAHWSTEDWKHNWTTLQAPGADDNGSGVSTLVELARILEPGVLPFDVLFVLFSGEELGMLGSIDFLENYESYIGDDIIGVLNIDMVGYSYNGIEGTTLYSNFESGWLAEMIERYAENNGYLNDFRLETLIPSPANSDHAPFWETGRPAITFVEPVDENGDSYYPYYHTMGDTIGWVNFDQVKRIGDIIGGFLSSFADDSIPDYAVLDSDIILERFRYPTSRTIFEEGDTIVVRISVRNLSSVSNTQDKIALRVTLTNTHGASELLRTVIPSPQPLKAYEMDIPLVLSENFAGENRVEASISVDGRDENTDNNAAAIRFAVSSEVEPVVLSHSFQPNPIEGSFRDAHFCINLAHERNLYIEVFNLEGESMCEAYAGDDWGYNLDAGMNCIRCGNLFGGPPELTSGVYIYRLIIYNGKTVEERKTGKFAVIR